MACLDDYVYSGFKVFGVHKILSSGKCGCGDEECQAAGKHPISSAWQYTPLWDDDQIEAMQMTGQFDTGFGVLCDNHLIVDVDPRNGGFEGLELLENSLGVDLIEQSEFVVKTGGGGWHIYFKNQGNASLVSKLKPFKGVDFKTSGFVVGAGSMHKSGNRYETHKGNPDDIKEAPQGLLEALKRPERQASNTGVSGEAANIDELLPHIPADDYEDWISVGMALHHETDGAGFTQWDEWSKKSDKYNPRGMDHKWHSFGKCSEPITAGTLRKMAEDNGYIEQVTFEPDYESDHGREETSEPVNIAEIDTTMPTGFAGKIVEWINQNSLFLRQNLSVGTALFTLGNAASLAYDDDMGGSSNLYVFGVAGSATGKEKIQQCCHEMMREAGLSAAVYGKIKSEQEITRNITRHKISAYVIDEFGILLRKLESASKKGGAAYLEGVIGELMSVFTKSTGYYQISGDLRGSLIKDLSGEIGRIMNMADENEIDDSEAEKRTKPFIDLIQEIKSGGIKNHHCSLIGFTTPVTFNECVSYESATNGFVGRALLFEDKDTNPRPNPYYKKTELPSHYAMRLAQMTGGGSASMDNDGPIMLSEHRQQIKTGKDARELLSRISDYFFEYSDAQKDINGLEALPRRAYELILRVSFILACADGKERTTAHVKWAYALVRKDIDNKINLASGNIAEQYKQKQDEITSKVLHCLDDAHGATLGAISNRYRRLGKENIQACLAALIDSGQVVKREEKPKRGPIRTVFLKR